MNREINKPAEWESEGGAGCAATSGVVVAPAEPRDVVKIGALLQAAGLPHCDLASSGAKFLVARDGAGRVVGAVGAEVHAPDALLRSLVVAPESRGLGLGVELVRRLDAAAAEWGVERWWLLTTTAERFFLDRGFSVAPRTSAPQVIAATGQFTGGCSSLAVCLTRARRVKR